MKVLITGGAGFIGSHLAELCLESGIFVHILDDFSTGTRNNIQRASQCDRCSVTSGSILDTELLDSIVRKVDVVFHLAAVVGVEYVSDNPADTVRTNVQGTLAVLDSAKKNGTPVLLTSSSEVYGKNPKRPLRESYDSLIGPSDVPRWCYAHSKALGESLAIEYHRKYGLPTVVVRLFNTVGPRQLGRYGMVIPRFVEAALSRSPLYVYGDGKQTRTFVHVSEITSALLRLVEIPEAAGEIINLGSALETSILTLAEKIIEVSHSSSAIRLRPYEDVFSMPFEDVRHRVPDITKAKNLFGFGPIVTLKQIIEDIMSSSCSSMIGEIATRGAAASRNKIQSNRVAE